MLTGPCAQAQKQDPAALPIESAQDNRGTCGAGGLGQAWLCGGSADQPVPPCWSSTSSSEKYSPLNKEEGGPQLILCVHLCVYLPVHVCTVCACLHIHIHI